MHFEYTRIQIVKVEFITGNYSRNRKYLSVMFIFPSLPTRRPDTSQGRHWPIKVPPYGKKKQNAPTLEGAFCLLTSEAPDLGLEPRT